MDERKTPPADQPVPSEGRKLLEQAFARASSQSDVPTPIADRPELSVATQMVMEGLPPAKAERIAAMRRDLAELQRQLIEAQQRIATELQGRADDAERFEAIEARLHAHEIRAQDDAARGAQLEAEAASLKAQLAGATAKAEELRHDVEARDAQLEEVRRAHREATEELAAHASSLTEAKKLLDTHAGDLAVRTTERDSEQETKSRLEKQLEDQRKQHEEITKQHQEATGQLEAQLASLRDANERIANHDSERDTLKGELAAARMKVRDIANHLVRLGQEVLADAGGEDHPPSGSHSHLPASTTHPNLPVVAKAEDRPKHSTAHPPPVPARATASHPVARPVETVLEVTEEPRARSLIALMLIAGVLLGAVATMAFVHWRGSSTTAADDHSELGASPSAARVSEPAVEHTAPSAMPSQPPAKSDQPSVILDPPPTAGSAAAATPSGAPAETNQDGVIVLPPEAADHRVFVDGKVVPVKGSRAVVTCGSHEIRIGSHGTPQTLDVACGAETTVPPDPQNH